MDFNALKRMKDGGGQGSSGVFQLLKTLQFETVIDNGIA